MVHLELEMGAHSGERVAPSLAVEQKRRIRIAMISISAIAVALACTVLVLHSSSSSPAPVAGGCPTSACGPACVPWAVQRDSQAVAELWRCWVVLQRLQARQHGRKRRLPSGAAILSAQRGLPGICRRERVRAAAAAAAGRQSTAREMR